MREKPNVGRSSPSTWGRAMRRHLPVRGGEPDFDSGTGILLQELSHCDARVAQPLRPGITACSSVSCCRAENRFGSRIAHSHCCTKYQAKVIKLFSTSSHKVILLEPT